MKSYENINNGININMENNFEAAYNLCTVKLNHETIIEYLINGNIYEKQIAALSFDGIKSESDVTALIGNLTGCDGKIREATAYKIRQILSNTDINIKTMFRENSAEVFADATIDINANICRMVIDSAILLSDNHNFSRIYANKVAEYAEDAIIALDKFEFRDKKYVINKQLFKLYWCLEGLIHFSSYIDSSKLSYIVEKSCKITEYTIREKTAELVKASGEFPEIIELLKHDENYYVRNVFLNH